MTNSLYYCMDDATREVVDLLLNDFIKTMVGKNDMAVVTGLSAAAAIIIAVHCQRNPEDDFQELSEMAVVQFKLALEVSGQRNIPK